MRSHENVSDISSLSLTFSSERVFQGDACRLHFRVNVVFEVTETVSCDKMGETLEGLVVTLSLSMA